MSHSTTQRAGMVLIALLGSLQMLGNLTGLNALKAIGLISAASPAPKVFCDVSGLEPFASEFTLAATTSRGQTIAFKIDPERYGRLKGPYNRRNAYGALLSYAPRLPKPLVDEVAGRALNPGSTLVSELGLPADPACVTLEIRTRTRGRNDVWTYRFPTTP